MGSNAIAIYKNVADPIAFSNDFALTAAAVTRCPLEHGKAVALTCLCEGITFHDYNRLYHTIDGKATMRADAMLAGFRINHGGSHKVISATGDKATVGLIDKNGEETEWSLTWEEAQKEAWPWGKKGEDGKPKLKTNWATPRARANMLWARATSEGLRRVCPELVAGIYTPEEIEDTIDDAADFPADKQITALESAAVHQEPTAPPTEDSEVIDASFEVVNGATTEPPQVVLDEIRGIYEDLGVSKENQDAALGKRGVKLLRHLSHDQAMEILKKLRDAKRSRAEVKNELPAARRRTSV